MNPRTGTPLPSCVLITFTNIYKNFKPVKVNINLRKELTGRALNANDFSFALNDGNKEYNALNDDNGDIIFRDIQFDVPGTFDFVATEVIGNEIGMGYSTERITVRVEVTDDGNGNLVANVIYPSDIVFNNVFNLNSVDHVIILKKILNGRMLQDGEFEFELKEAGSTIQTVRNKADGTIKFQPITYTQPGEYDYVIVEKDNGLPGVAYDNRQINVTVEVYYLNGMLLSRLRHLGVDFINTYTSPGSNSTDIQLEAEKKLNGKALKADKFEFEVKEGTNVVATGKNDSNGKIVFSKINYNSEGKHTYKVVEKAGTESEITYDSTEHEVVVDVTRDGGGNLVAAAKYTNDVKPVFVNVYKSPDSDTSNIVIPDEAPKSVQAVIELSVELTGRTLAVNEFEFNLKDSTQLKQSVRNGENGKIMFNPIEFTAVGTYEFVVSQTIGNADGITYDKSDFVIKIVVVEENGKLVAKIVYPEDTIFNNFYNKNMVINNVSPKEKLPKTSISSSGISILGTVILGLGAFVANKKKNK